jgi:hypothetical protein
MMLEYLEDLTNLAIENDLQLKEIQLKLSYILCHAQAKYERVADLNSSSKTPKFRVGDRIWLLRRNVKTARPCNDKVYL